MIEELDVVTLQDEDGAEHRFNVIDIVEVDGRRYAVLLPEDEEDAAAVVFRMESDDKMIPIEDDEELGRVMAALEETEGYSEIILEEGEEDEDDLGVLEGLGDGFENNGDNSDAEDEDDS